MLPKNVFIKSAPFPRYYQNLSGQSCRDTFKQFRLACYGMNTSGMCQLPANYKSYDKLSPSAEWAPIKNISTQIWLVVRFKTPRK